MDNRETRVRWQGECPKALSVEEQSTEADTKRWNKRPGHEGARDLRVVPEWTEQMQGDRKNACNRGAI